MEYTLCNSDIFDPTLAEKFESVILNEMHQFKKEKVFKFTASFHVDLLKDASGFESFALPPSDKIVKRNKNSEKEKMYDVLGYQLKQLEGVLLKSNIEYYSSAIQGDQLESTQIIKIQIEEDMSEPITTNKGKKRQRGKTSSVIPSIIYTQNLIHELSSKRLNKLYNDLFNVIRNKKIMSEILGIEVTDDDNLLFKAFVKEYGELWLTTSAKEKELREKLINRATEVIEKYIED